MPKVSLRRSFFASRSASFSSFFCRLLLTASVAVSLVHVFDANAATISLGALLESRPATQPWSASFVDSVNKLKKIDKDLKVSLSYQAFDPTSAEPVARQMLGAPVDVLIMHSFALNDVAHKLAAQNPKVVMSVSSFDQPMKPNLNISTVSYLQVGYSQCWLLAKLSKSGKIGFVGAMPVPYANELLKACELGANAAKSGTTVLSAFSNSFSDQQATREQARTLVERGADGLFPASATEDSLGGFQLCEQQKIPCVGWASDIKRYAPNYGVSSAVIDWSVSIHALVDQALTGKLDATTFDATYGNHGLVSVTASGNAAKLIPANVKADFDAMVRDLIAEKVSLPKSTAHPCCE
jgi:simple sugar transport system substrate-binding protein